MDESTLIEIHRVVCEEIYKAVSELRQRDIIAYLPEFITYELNDESELALRYDRP